MQENTEEKDEANQQAAGDVGALTQDFKEHLETCSYIHHDNDKTFLRFFNTWLQHSFKRGLIAHRPLAGTEVDVEYVARFLGMHPKAAKEEIDAAVSREGNIARCLWMIIQRGMLRGKE